MAGLEPLIDAGSFVPDSDGLNPTDPLNFPGYKEKVEAARSAGHDESVISGAATIAGRDVHIAWFDFSFLAGSMGEVAGERIAVALETAAARGVPLIMRTASGGARMQEGMRALIQMPKLIVARLALADAHQPLIMILGNPTTGGVLASICALGDYTIAESGATIGFAGPRLVERHSGRPVSGDSHTAFSALGNGLVDAVLTPDELKASVGRALDVLAPDDPQVVAAPPEVVDSGEMLPWEAVQRARDEERPTGPELLRDMSDSHLLLRGDRAGGEDLAVSAAVARIAGRRALVLALDRSLHPGPRAYRKACRAMDISARLGLPIVTLIDTRGADPGEDSEGGGIAWSIAELFRKVLMAPAPVLSIVTGEGGSGGALAFAVGDILLAYRGSIFSVIGPELAAEILWRDPSRAAEAAQLLRLTADDLVGLGIADGLLREPLDGDSLGRVVAYHLGRLTDSETSRPEMMAARRKRWRRRVH